MKRAAMGRYQLVVGAFFWGATVVGLLAPRSASACSALPCDAGYLYPEAGSTIPANAPALLWQPTGRLFENWAESSLPPPTWTGPDGAVSFDEERSGPSSPILVRPSRLRPGSHRFTEPEDYDRCPDFGGYEPFSVEFEVGLERALPTTLGAVTVAPPRRGPVEVPRGGQCSDLIDAVSVELSVALSPEAEPWRPLLLGRTFVDGREWRPQAAVNRRLQAGASRRGRFEDAVYADCRDASQPWEDDGVEEGRHSVWFEGRVVGVPDLVLRTDPVEIELRCEDPVASGPDAGARDAVVGGSDDRAFPEARSGCRCVAGARTTPGGSWTLAGIVGALLFGVRARRRTH